MTLVGTQDGAEQRVNATSGSSGIERGSSHIICPPNRLEVIKWLQRARVFAHRAMNTKKALRLNSMNRKALA
jgi:hypothetical protein